MRLEAGRLQVLHRMVSPMLQKKGDLLRSSLVSIIITELLITNFFHLIVCSIPQKNADEIPKEIPVALQSHDLRPHREPL